MHYINTKSILSAKNGMNIYRGCQHGCIYCDSRSHCYGMEHLFEDVAVKENALLLLENALRNKRKKCMIGTGSMSDPYMPLEKEIGFSRKAAELIAKYGFGLTLITKSADVLRDIELFRQINQQAKCVIQMTLTTFDEELCRIVEPNVSTTVERYHALKKLQAAGIPTVVWLCPILPFINDSMENLSGLLEYCADAGVKGIICFGMGVTLRDGNREYFYRNLDRHFPGLKERYIKTYGNAYMLESPQSGMLMRYFHDFCESHGIMHNNDEIFEYLNTFEDKTAKEQLSLFD